MHHFTRKQQVSKICVVGVCVDALVLQLQKSIDCFESDLSHTKPPLLESVENLGEDKGLVFV
jgi:hypothetical protein